MAYSFLPRDLRVTLRDGTGVPITKTWPGQLDDVGLASLTGARREWVIIHNKDGVHSRRKGKLKHPSFSLSIIMDKGFADVATESPLNWIERLGVYASGGGSPLVSVDTDSDGFVMGALLEWLDEDGNAADSVVLSHVHVEDYGMSPGGDSFVLTAEFKSTGTQVWA